MPDSIRIPSDRRVMCYAVYTAGSIRDLILTQTADS